MQFKPLLRFLSHIDGRDKGLKLVQYTGKIVAWGLAKSPQNKVVKSLLRRLASTVAAMSVARKIMRVSNWLDPLHRLAAVASGQVKFEENRRELFWQLLDTLGVFVGFLTNIADDITTLAIIGAFTVKVRKRFEPLAAQLWFANILITVVTSVRVIRAAHDLLAEHMEELALQGAGQNKAAHAELLQQAGQLEQPAGKEAQPEKQLPAQEQKTVPPAAHLEAPATRVAHLRPTALQQQQQQQQQQPLSPNVVTTLPASPLQSPSAPPLLRSASLQDVGSSMSKRDRKRMKYATLLTLQHRHTDTFVPNLDDHHGPGVPVRPIHVTSSPMAGPQYQHPGMPPLVHAGNASSAAAAAGVAGQHGLHGAAAAAGGKSVTVVTVGQLRWKQSMLLIGLVKLLADGGFCAVDVFPNLKLSPMFQNVCGLLSAGFGSYKRWVEP